MNSVVALCWSWHHDQPCPVEPCARFCAEHASELSACAEVERELEQVRCKMASHYVEAGSPHPFEFQMVEHAVASFLCDGETGLTRGKGFRFELQRPKRAELDIVIDLGDRNAGAWNHPHRSQIAASPPCAHLEVIWRTKAPDWGGVRDDLSRLHDTAIAGALQDPPRKVWTALILAGPGWRGHEMRLERELHQHFHTRNLPPRQIGSGKCAFWDYPDLVTLPGCILKKHDYAPEPGSLQRIPAYAELPVGAHDPYSDVRPLSAARLFFRHHLRNHAAGAPNEGPAAATRERAAAAGPRWHLERELAVITVGHPMEDVIWARRLDSASGRTEFLEHRRTSDRCSDNFEYRYIQVANSPPRRLA